MEESKTFVIIDGNSLMHRAFHALPPLTNRDGIYTNAVFGFLSMMIKVVNDYSPEYLAVAFDLKGPTFRHKKYDAYKAGRKATAPELAPQFDLIREVLSAMGVRILTCATFEADDILGTFARRCEEAGIHALLVTGDRDSMQLVSETSHVLYTKRGVTDIVLYTPEKVLEDFGVTPEHITDLKGLMGDASDNIPGIPGIGEKTAVKLLTTYGTLEEVLAHAEADLKGKQREKIIEGSANGLLSKMLATINRNVPLDDVSLEDCRRQPFDGGFDLLRKLDMTSIITRLDKMQTAPSQPSTPSIPWQEETVLSAISDIEELIALADAHPDIPLAFFSFRGQISLAFSDGRRYTVAIAENLLSIGLDYFDAIKTFSSLFSGNRKLVLYNAKQLMTELSSYDLSLSAPYDDELIIQYLLAPQKGKYEAPENASSLLEKYLTDYSALTAAGMQSLYETIELPLTKTLFSMERAGFLVDEEVLSSLGKSYDQQISDLKARILELCGVGDFNINSTQQLGDVLFNKMQLPAGRKTQRGYSTDAETLQNLADKHPVINEILTYRQITKLKSTYIDGLLKLKDRNGRIHSWFDQTIAATGRISSSEPNLQNIPVRTEMGKEIRRAFIASPGCSLVDADYSQIELRILAHLSGDAAMQDAFLRGQDIHTRTAAEVYGVPLEEVTPQMRSSAKAVNFGIVYGISDFGLARDLHISRREAGDFIAKYFARYPAIHRFMDECVTKGKTNGYSETLYGRRRPLPELSSPNYNTRQFGERAAMNTPVQGTAADIIKIAMNAVYTRLQDEHLGAKLILQVHDELIVDTPEEETEKVIALLRDCMEHAATLSVPLLADVHAGRSWFDTK